MAEKLSVFQTLSSVDVKGKIEKKGKVDYLSWSHAWSIVKELYPTADRRVYEDPSTGLNFFTDGNTAYVKVGVLIDGLEHIDYLPVMDYRNVPIPVGKVTSFDVTKAIQRSTAKCIAMHGLALSLWIGEDAPENGTKAEPEKPKAKEKQTLNIGDADWEKVMSYVVNNAELPLEEILHKLGKRYALTKKAIEAITATLEGGAASDE
jgi:hypothetical protein